jgi:5-methyltetrahydrofolate--homocysteine methyltransferase
MSKQARAPYIETVREDYAQIAAAHARGQDDKRRLTLADARANAIKLEAEAAPAPQFLGTRVFENYPLEKLVPYIDWTPFFATWELTGRYPAILHDEKYGVAARGLFEDAQAMLKQIVQEKWVKAQAIAGFWPAAREGDDIAVFDESGKSRIATLHGLRQQIARRDGRPNLSIADFVLPSTAAPVDHVGAFAVTAGIGEDEIADRFKHANDDYSAIMIKALADRLAEAFAEHLHERVRKEFWGYAAGESFTPAELIAESYQGIRPAPGYPAQPDHTEKETLFKLIEGERIGINLTESFAMWPGASVCGLYFSHPQSHYFGVGKIERDQVEDYARRKGWSVEECERWLAPILNYDPNAREKARAA